MEILYKTEICLVPESNFIIMRLISNEVETYTNYCLEKLLFKK